MIDIFHTIIPLLAENSTSTKRLSTLKCIGELSEYHSYVTLPYRDHPDLMSSLLNCLHLEKDFEITEKSLRVFGRLGALDPFQQSWKKTIVTKFDIQIAIFYKIKKNRNFSKFYRNL